jgi:hypothetical protein
MSNYENAALVLRTSDLTAGSTTNVGTCDQYKTNMTWNNINLRTLLGSMYDKYEKFNLCLNTVSTSNVTGVTIPGNSSDDRIVQLYLSGLPFINQTYDVVRGCNTNNAIIGTFNFPSVAGSVTQYFYSSNLATFDKRQNTLNINVFYNRVKTDGAGSYNVNAGGTAYPDMIFIFDIFGIPNDNLNYGQRLIIPPNPPNF